LAGAVTRTTRCTGSGGCSAAVASTYPNDRSGGLNTCLAAGDPGWEVTLSWHCYQQLRSMYQACGLNTCLAAGDPGWEVTLSWHCYQQLRSMYQATNPADGRRIAEAVIISFPTCPIPEVARLGRTLRQWRSHVPARFDTHQISNGGTEAVNLIIEKTRRRTRL
jgi:hypothetical protein